MIRLIKSVYWLHQDEIIYGHVLLAKENDSCYIKIYDEDENTILLLTREDTKEDILITFINIPQNITNLLNNIDK